MELLERRPRLVLLTLFVLALALRLAFWAGTWGTALDDWHRWDQSDMSTYLEQAREIREVDPWAATPYHPYHNWQQLAPPEKWLEWYGPHAFHQAPAYAYLLAAGEGLLSDPLPLFKLVQVLLGAGSVVLVFRITQRLAGSAAGVAAALLAATYGPLLYLEPQLLREGPATFVQLLVLERLLAWAASEDRGPRRAAVACGALGLLVGLFATFHEMASVLLLVVLISVALLEVRRPARAGVAVGAVALGYLVGFAPLLVRNVAVGAGPFDVSCRKHVNFVEANVADAVAGGAIFAAPSESIIRILDEADGDFGKAVSGTLATYDGDVGLMLSNWWKRFSFVWQRFEQPDNTCLYFYEQFSPLLAALPDFRLLFPLGLAGGLVVLLGPLLGRLRRAPGAEPPPEVAVWRRFPSGHLILLLFVAGVAASLSLVHTVARFRLYLVPWFWIYGGVLVPLVVAWVRSRRFARLGLAAALLALAVLAQQRMTPDFAIRAPRLVDYHVAVQIALEDGRTNEATEYAVVAGRTYRGAGGLFGLIGRAHERGGNLRAARDSYGRGLQLQPGSAPLRSDLARVQQLLRGR